MKKFNLLTTLLILNIISSTFIFANGGDGTPPRRRRPARSPMRTPEPSPELTPRGRHRARPADADHLVGNLEHAFGLTERTPGLGARQTREAAFQAQREARDAGEPMPTVAATAVALFAAILVQRMQNHGLAPCSAEASGAFDGSGPAPGF